MKSNFNHGSFINLHRAKNSYATVVLIEEDVTNEEKVATINSIKQLQYFYLVTKTEEVRQ